MTYWAIEKYDDRDFQDKDLLAWDVKQDVYKCYSWIIYNQREVDRYSCTGQAWCWVISDFTWLFLPLCFHNLDMIALLVSFSYFIIILVYFNSFNEWF